MKNGKRNKIKISYTYTNNIIKMIMIVNVKSSLTLSYKLTTKLNKRHTKYHMMMSEFSNRFFLVITELDIWRLCLNSVLNPGFHFKRSQIGMIRTNNSILFKLITNNIIEDFDYARIYCFTRLRLIHNANVIFLILLTLWKLQIYVQRLLFLKHFEIENFVLYLFLLFYNSWTICTLNIVEFIVHESI